MTIFIIIGSITIIALLWIITAAGRAIERSGIGPRTRSWITKEEPTT